MMPEITTWWYANLQEGIAEHKIYSPAEGDPGAWWDDHYCKLREGFQLFATQEAALKCILSHLDHHILLMQARRNKVGRALDAVLEGRR